MATTAAALPPPTTSKEKAGTPPPQVAMLRRRQLHRNNNKNGSNGEQNNITNIQFVYIVYGNTMYMPCVTQIDNRCVISIYYMYTVLKLCVCTADIIHVYIHRVYTYYRSCMRSMTYLCSINYAHCRHNACILREIIVLYTRTIIHV